MPLQDYSWLLKLCFATAFCVIVADLSTGIAQECNFVQSNYSLGDRPDILLTGDFDSDGDLDIAAAEFGSQEEVHILLNDGQGNFPYQTQTCFGPIFDVSDVEVADLDGDGHLDFAVASEFTSINYVEVSFWLNDGNAGFSRQGEILVQSDSVDFSPNITIADFDNNSIVDIALKAGGVTTNSDIYVFFGNNNGVSFDEPPEKLRMFTRAQIYSADVNNDSVPDILATSTSQSRLCVFLSNGDRTFQEFEQFFNWDRIEAIADFNGDSNIDLLCSSFLTALGIATGDGHGEFNFCFGSGIQSASRPATILEVDGDGRFGCRVSF